MVSPNAPESSPRRRRTLNKTARLLGVALNDGLYMNWIKFEDKKPFYGQKVLLFANGVVQEETWQYEECDTNDYGGVAEYWSRDDFHEFPIDALPEHFWMPLPTKPDV